MKILIVIGCLFAAGAAGAAVLEGDIALQRPMEIKAADSGTRIEAGVNGARLLRARAVRTSGTLPAEAKTPPDFERFGTVRAHAPLFFYDGKWAVEARWPNEGYATFTNGIIAASRPEEKHWNLAKFGWICGYLRHDWCYERIRLAGCTNGVLSLAHDSSFGVGGDTWTARDARRFCVFGVKEELDSPGEYFIDWEKRTYEFREMEGGVKEFMMTTGTGPVLAIENATNVVIRGLAFEFGPGDAIVAKNCSGLVIEDCTFRNFGGNAIRIENGAGCRVARCRFESLGLSGVILNGGDRKTLTPGSNVVEDCVFRDFARVNRTYESAVKVSGCGNRVSRCRISDAPHTGIFYWGNDHLLEDNELSWILRECGDAGAFYTGRDPTSRGNVLRGNYVHDCGTLGLKTANVMGFYLDDCDCGDSLVSNRVERVPRGILLGGGQDNHLVGNRFTDCDIGISVDCRGVNDKGKFDSPTDPSWQMTRKVKSMPYDREPWKSRYPLLFTYLDDHPQEPRHITIRGNVFDNCRLPIEWWRVPDEARLAIDEKDNVVVNPPPPPTSSKSGTRCVK
jgi:hypothetical protein